ncbi:MAG: GNAT family N-acetyltransferase [Calditrichaeota bacterium]|nr:GNAT family N-acetyltransferase [Calditrichota bacterium]
MVEDNYSEINKLKQKQMLKIVSSSFYRELVKYGVNHSDIVSVSTNLLDYVTESKHKSIEKKENSFDFKVEDIRNNWTENSTISLNGVNIRPLVKENIKQVTKWLKAKELSGTFIGFLPKEKKELEDYLLNSKDKFFFATYYKNEKFVGIIGAERIDDQFKKLEMKKFIGEKEFRGKGIGKFSTFLFLYYVFNILEFNKVFIHSMDTNIKNINLNSHFGFDLEGLLFNEVSVNGLFHDVIRMGLIKSNWHRLFSSADENDIL